MSIGEDELVGGYGETVVHNRDIRLLMAYTHDYSLGRICEKVNHYYADKHGYQFHAVVQPFHEMLGVVCPKKHCAWFKIRLLLDELKILLDRRTEGDEIAPIQYIGWIDADAMVIKPNVSVQYFLRKGQFKELIIAEDMHAGCPINTGVVFLKVCPWSLSLLEDVWQCTRYDSTLYYEQSALVKILRQRKERLDRVIPFHSFAGGPSTVKLFPHVAVYPHTELNSNVGVHRSELELYLNDDYASVDEPNLANQEKEAFENSHDDGDDREDREEYPFVFHVAGVKGKLDFLRSAIRKYRIPCTFEEDLRLMTFKLSRNTLGHYRDPNEKET
jgi:hypothetical protein